MPYLIELRTFIVAQSELNYISKWMWNHIILGLKDK
jgi:hypothetical protein